jgi:hypothetical protein
MSTDLPKWPNEDDYISIEPPDGHEAGREDYERARADAAMARLRKCEAALLDICSTGSRSEYQLMDIAREALSAIGPLPPETKP